MTIKDLKITHETLRLEYAKQLALYELELSRAERPVGSDALKSIQEYSMSTITRRRFVMICCVAAINNEYLPVASIRKKLGTCRAAMDTMIYECQDADWISVKRNKQNHRRVQATEITLKSWLEYADFCNGLLDKYGFVHLNGARRATENLLQTK